MNKKIYHGGETIVKSPAFGTGRPYNDFGLGFYCTEYSRYAGEWAAKRNKNGFISEYSLDTDGLRIINLCSTQYTPLHWLSLLFSYREFDTSSDTAYRAKEYIGKYFSVDHQGCDCIIGWRADNTCFMFAQQFLDGEISYQSLRGALISDDSNRQFVLKSNRAFDRISFSGYRTALSDDYYPAAFSRSIRAVRNMAASFAPGLDIQKIIEEEVRPYDTRLR